MKSNIGVDPTWSRSGSDVQCDGVVVSSRIRLARNLRGVAFPGWAGASELVRVYAMLRDLLVDGALLEGAVAVSIDALSPVESDVLRERHIISAELVSGGGTSGVIYAPGENISVMINEEDHLRLQVVSSGLDFRRAWTALDRLDTGLDRRLSYAYSPMLGYLTACPSNVGTGMRASVMVHLSGLKLMAEADRVVHGLNRMGFAVRGAFGEGSEARGGLYQVSNQTTLGVSEAETLERIEDVAQTLMKLELAARQRLVELQEPRLSDYVGRAFGILSHARILSTGEAMDLISGLMLGLEFGIVDKVDMVRLTGLMLEMQPGHLQKKAGRVLPVVERDIFRAAYIRGVLTGIELKSLI